MAYTEIELQTMLAAARESFMKLQGVVGVGFGLKEKEGGITETICWRVYVSQKMEGSSLPPEAKVPKEFMGFPTDVIEMFPAQLKSPCEDANMYSPVLSGATISNLIAAANGTIAKGTLGFFATINGNADAKENVVLVTNNHVLAKNGGNGTSIISQPYQVLNAGVATITFMVDANGSQSAVPQRHQALGQVQNIGRQFNHPFLYGDESNPGSHQGYWVDAATAKLNLNISSWCDTHCGVKFKPEVAGLNINNQSTIDGFERVSMTSLLAGDYNVVKWGGRSSRTEGKIIDCVGPAFPDGQNAFNTIWIVATSPNCDGNMLFELEGDSGSAIINSNRKIVGLLFAGGERTINGAQVHVTFASHIEPVLNYLAVTPITTAVTHTYMSTKAEGPGSITGDHLFLLKEQLRNFPEGAAMLGIFDVHRHELVELVNHCRPVTVAWQRNQGPAFTNRIMANSRNPEIPIPGQIEGISLRRLCEAMLPLLLAHGSPALQQSLNTWSARILAKTEGLHNLHALVASLQTDSKV